MSSYPYSYPQVQSHTYSHAQTHNSTHSSAFTTEPQSNSLPAAPPGTFRLFRLLTLYPEPRVVLQTFPYSESDSVVGATNPTASSTDWHPATINNINEYDGCNFHQGHAHACPPYQAISYAWNPKPSRDPGSENVVNDNHLSNTENIPRQPVTVVVPSFPNENMTSTIIIHITNHLLYGLLTVQELCTPGWLFVDAICIDQHDAHDKALQVQGMDKVFRGAGRVLIWLGSDHTPVLDSGSEPTSSNPSNSTQTNTFGGSTSTGVNAIMLSSITMSMGTCLDLIPQLVQQLEAYQNDRKQQQSQDVNSKPVTKPTLTSSSSSSTASPTALPGFPPLNSPLWAALERLRLNSWFERLWVVQEVVLSRQALILYGTRSLLWSIYARLTAVCELIINSQFSYEHTTDLVNQLYFAYNSRVSAITKMHTNIADTLTIIDSNPSRYVNDSRDSPLVLDILINLIRTSKASVPLDRVYGIMGLLSSRLRDSLRIDYSDIMMNSYCLKWVELFHAILLRSPAAAERIFSYAAYLEKHPNLPSWCPNLADNGEKRGISSGTAASAGMPSAKDWTGDINLCTVKIVPGTSYIRLSGFQIDKVAHVIDLSWVKDSLNWSGITVNQDSGIDSGVANKILQTFWKCIKHMAVPGTSSSNGDPILARCLVANAYDDQPVKTAQLLQDYTAFGQFLEYYTWGGPMSGDTLKKSTKTAALRFGNRFQRMARKRAIFVTNSGHTGLCSHRVKEGDVLSVFLNFRLPYLLRKLDGGDKYELVGETYVDGIMRGEVFKGRKLDRETPKDFVIC